VKLIAGAWGEHNGPAPERATAPFIADIMLPADTAADVPVPEGHAAFVYVFEGGLQVGSTPIGKGNIGVLSEGGALQVDAAAEGARFLIVAGKPLREPIAKYGPFVMNTQEEIRQAISDYQSGRF
jgi:quercetin 2,3-dioxygenase